jgi:hypothetical protein
MATEPLDLVAVKREMEHEFPFAGKTVPVRALIHALEEARAEAVKFRRVYSVALDDRERWKKMWHAKERESEHRWGLYSAALVDLAGCRENRNDYESAFFDARDERDALLELVTTLRGDLYMAREMGR